MIFKFVTEQEIVSRLAVSKLILSINSDNVLQINGNGKVILASYDVTNVT